MTTTNQMPHRYNITERVKFGRPPTFQAVCSTCGWVSVMHQSEVDAENDADGHMLAMTR